MRRTRLSLVAALAVTSSATLVALPSAAGAAAGDTVQLIAMNDFHGRISPQSGGDGSLVLDDGTTQTVGGAAHIGAALTSLRSQYGDADSSFFVGAGDLISASPYNSSVFKDEPTIEVLNALGMDSSSVGNHEFDRGQEELYRVSGATDAYEAAHGHEVVACPETLGGEAFEPGVDGCFTDSTGEDFGGTDFPYLAANVTGADGAPVLPPYQVLEFPGSDGATNRVGLIGVVTADTPNIVSPAGIEGLTFGSEAAAINTYTAELQSQGIEAIAVLIHEGGAQAAGGTPNTCNNDLAGSPIRAINDAINTGAGADVDLIISAHTHTAYNCSLPGGADGERLVTQAGFYGKALTDIRLTLDGDSDVDRSASVATNVPVLRTATDSTIAGIVAYWDARSAEAGNVPVGEQTADLDRAYRAGAPVRDAESTVGNLVADAQLATWPDADVAIMNPGGLRADINCAAANVSDPQGVITYADAFAVQPFGNTVNSVELTGQGIHDVLEQQWALRGSPAALNFLQLSVAGMTFEFDPRLEVGNRIPIETITIGGQPLVPSETYTVVANSFLISGGDNFGAFVSGRPSPDTEVVTGPNDVDAFVEYLRAQDEPIDPPALDRAVSLDPAQPFDDDRSGTRPCNTPATATISDDTPNRGDSLTVTGANFVPGESVTATLADGRVLGTATAAATGATAGTAAITFTVPRDLPAGQHVVTLTSQLGEQATTSFTLRSTTVETVEKIKETVRTAIGKLLAWLFRR